LNVEQRYRLVYKPLVFVLCLLPLAWLLCGAFGLLGVSLGADPVKKLEHELGLRALQLLLLTLLITPIRQLFNLTHLPRLRRMLGLFAFFYALLHFTVYLSLDLEFNFGTFFKDVAKRPYITIGLLALVLLIPLAVTSTNKMMRRLGRRWQKLHRLIYPIAILGVWHFWWQVKRDIREPLIYAVILAILLGYRVIRARRKATTVAAAAPRATSAGAPASSPERSTSTSGSATVPGRT
jgi:methionine sulfoxide reductase heme-binding subunit